MPISDINPESLPKEGLEEAVKTAMDAGHIFVMLPNGVAARLDYVVCLMGFATELVAEAMLKSGAKSPDDLLGHIHDQPPGVH